MSREWTPGNLPDLLDYAHRFASLANSNGTQVVLYQYWNYEDENIAVQEDINAAFNTLRHALATNGIDAIILPAGEAFYAAVDEIPSLSRPALYQDNIHPSDTGYYLSALMHFAVLYRQYRLPTGSSVGPSLTFTIGADAEDAGARLIEEWSLDLMTGSWTNQPPAGVVRTRNNDDVTWTLDGTWTTLYYRAHIQLPTE